MSSAFDKGVAVICGKIWRGKYKGKYLGCIDADNIKAIDELLTIDGHKKSLSSLAKKIIIEQHMDNLIRAHFYFITERPLKGRSSDKVSAEMARKIAFNEIPAFEIKSIGKIMICAPSVHKDGDAYEIIGTLDPMVLDNTLTDLLEQHIDTICRKYGLSYLTEMAMVELMSTIEIKYQLRSCLNLTRGLFKGIIGMKH